MSVLTDRVSRLDDDREKEPTRRTQNTYLSFNRQHENVLRPNEGQSESQITEILSL